MMSNPLKPEKNSDLKPVIFIFLDGVGIGSSDPLNNPVAELKAGIFPFGPGDCWDLPNGGIARKVDARLDTPGLPQSATGQATLFTGINAAKVVNRHLPGFPTPKLKRLIGEKSIFRQIKDQKGSVVFANCYSPQFFESPPRWISVTTAMCISSGTRLLNLEDLYNGRSLFFDFTNQALRVGGLELESFSPAKAARVLIRLAKEFDFCLYENFLSDLIGHRLGIKDALAHLLSVEEFLMSLVSSIDLDEVSIVVTSDHGNIEDMSSGRHTINPVPIMIWGKLCKEFESAEDTLTLCDITPRIMNFLYRE